ncbi:helix-turn-helix domain protein [Peptococcaceae bacterium CEB3]|nr:helix-turn-helix domain protein [Peptococcaceae bacterium CEB3]
MKNESYQRKRRYTRGEFSWDKLPVYLTIRQAASILNCCYSEMYLACKDGKVPYFQVDNRLLRIPKEDFRQLVEKNTHKEGGKNNEA